MVCMLSSSSTPAGLLLFITSLTISPDGISAEGIFRRAGSHVTAKTVKAKYEKGTHTHVPTCRAHTPLNKLASCREES